MAIIKVNQIQNANALNKYLLNHDPHEETDLIKDRNLMVWGQNYMRTYDHKWDGLYVSAQQYAVRALANKKKKKTQAFHMIISFSDEDFPPVTNKKDLDKQTKQAYQIVNGFLKKEMPSNSQYYCALQRDGDGHKLHAHVAISSLLMNGKSFNTNILSINRRIDRLKAPKKDKKEEEKAEQVKKDKKKKKEKYKPKFVKSAGLYERFQDYCDQHFEAEVGHKYKKIMRDTVVMHNGKEGAYSHRRKKEGKDPTSWREQMMNAIVDVEHHVSSLDEFKQQLDKKYMIKTKERTASMMTVDGTKLKRRAFTYCQVNEEGKIIHKARDFRYRKDGSVRGLGELTTPQNVQFVIDHEIQLRMAQQEAEREEKNREAILKADKMKQQKKREQEAKQRKLQEERKKQQQKQSQNDDGLGF